jgi:hypothetical protein
VIFIHSHQIKFRGTSLRERDYADSESSGILCYRVCSWVDSFIENGDSPPHTSHMDPGV